MAARAEADAPAEAARPAPLATEGRSGPADAIGDALTRSGRFGWGAGIEVLGLGLTEAWSGDRGATGLHLLTTAQIDLDPH